MPITPAFVRRLILQYQLSPNTRYLDQYHRFQSPSSTPVHLSSSSSIAGLARQPWAQSSTTETKNIWRFSSRAYSIISNQRKRLFLIKNTQRGGISKRMWSKSFFAERNITSVFPWIDNYLKVTPD